MNIYESYKRDELETLLGEIYSMINDELERSMNQTILIPTRLHCATTTLEEIRGKVDRVGFLLEEIL